MLFNIPDGKSPGDDGFNNKFYKHCWEVVSDDVTDVVLDFIKTEKLLKVINVTTLTLVPKTKCPEHVSDFMPIACCLVLYKCITKLISEKLNEILPDIISPSQGAFVARRSIINNVMICRDIVKMYKRKNTRAGCLMKLDLKKAYDTVNWSFVQQMLVGIGFPPFFVKLIMECVTSPRFSIMLNGATCGFFKSHRGLRQ